MSSNKKPTVDWIATISGIEKTMPIIRASQFKHSWQKKAAMDFKKEGSLTTRGPSRNTDVDVRHTSKCPGLQAWHNTGWIMRLHQDVRIQVMGQQGFKWITPIVDPEAPDLITYHSERAIAPFFDTWPEGTMQKIVKFNLPWVARIPKGYKLLMCNPMWSDDWRFTTCSGILDPELGHAGVGTIPVLWHSLGGEYTIEAGTPMAQFILIPKDEPAFENINYAEDKNYSKESRLHFLMMKQKFTVNYGKIREFWRKYGW